MHVAQRQEGQKLYNMDHFPLLPLFSSLVKGKSPAPSALFPDFRSHVKHQSLYILSTWCKGMCELSRMSSICIQVCSNLCIYKDLCVFVYLLGMSYLKNTVENWIMDEVIFQQCLFIYTIYYWFCQQDHIPVWFICKSGWLVSICLSVHLQETKLFSHSLKVIEDS